MVGSWELGILLSSDLYGVRGTLNMNPDPSHPNIFRPTHKASIKQIYLYDQVKLFTTKLQWNRHVDRVNAIPEVQLDKKRHVSLSTRYFIGKYELNTHMIWQWLDYNALTCWCFSNFNRLQNQISRAIHGPKKDATVWAKDSCSMVAKHHLTLLSLTIWMLKHKILGRGISCCPLFVFFFPYEIMLERESSPPSVHKSSSVPEGGWVKVAASI